MGDTPTFRGTHRRPLTWAVLAQRGPTNRIQFMALRNRNRNRRRRTPVCQFQHVTASTLKLTPIQTTLRRLRPDDPLLVWSRVQDIIVAQTQLLLRTNLYNLNNNLLVLVREFLSLR